jgi:hypothetical protein
MDMMLRFLIGGIVVSVFAILGDVVKPESLGGVCCGPHHCAGYAGADNAQTWGRVCGDRGKVDDSWRHRIFAYACVVSFVLMRWRPKALTTAIAFLPLWFAVAAALWALWLRR